MRCSACQQENRAGAKFRRDCGAKLESACSAWRQHRKHREAHNMLPEIDNWFTEGFDTKDLQEAKALLEELAIEI